MARIAILRSKSSGGIEPRVAKEASVLADAGHKVTVVLWDRECIWPMEEIRPNYRIYRAPLQAPENSLKTLMRLPAWWAASWRFLRVLKPDVVHAVDLDTLLPALAAKRHWGAKVVYNIFDFYGYMLTHRLAPLVRGLLAWLERWVAKRADLIVLPEAERAEFFGRAMPAPIVVVRNTPEPWAAAVTPEPKFTVIYGGQLSRDRGVEDLAWACKAAGVTLLLAGSGQDALRLLSCVVDTGSGWYLGRLTDHDLLIRTASAHAVAALYDPAVLNNRWAASTKLYTALMLGKPVITNEGTLAGDFVKLHGVGVVVAYGDREALRQAIALLAHNPSLCVEMGRRGKALYEDAYCWPADKDRLIDAYRRLLKGRPALAMSIFLHAAGQRAGLNAAPGATPPRMRKAAAGRPGALPR